MILPLLCDVKRSSGEPELWILEGVCVTESDATSADVLDLCFNRHQFEVTKTEETAKLLLDQTMEDLVSKIIFSQSEPPRWVVILSDSQIAPD